MFKRLHLSFARLLQHCMRLASVYHISCATAQTQNDVLYYQQYTIYNNVVKKANLFTAASCLCIGRIFFCNFLTTFRVSFKKIVQRSVWQLEDSGF